MFTRRCPSPKCIFPEPRRVTVRDPLTPSAMHPAFAILTDKTAHNTVVEKTVRGLYFHHTAKIISNRYPLIVQWLRVLTDDQMEPKISKNKSNKKQNRQRLYAATVRRWSGSFVRG